MTSQTLVGVISCAGVVIACTVSAVCAAKTGAAWGTKRWVHYVLAAYGVMLGAVALWQPIVGAFAVGLVVPLLGSNALNLWQVNALGAEAVRDQWAELLAKSGRSSYVWATVTVLALRAAMALVLVLSCRPGSAGAGLAWGMLTSIPLGCLGALRWMRTVGRRPAADAAMGGA